MVLRELHSRRTSRAWSDAAQPSRPALFDRHEPGDLQHIVVLVSAAAQARRDIPRLPGPVFHLSNYLRTVPQGIYGRRFHPGPNSRSGFQSAVPADRIVFAMEGKE